MRNKFFCPRWGSEMLPWDDFMSKVKAAGYDGIEWAIAFDTPVIEIDKVWGLAHKHGLLLIAQHYDTNHADYQRHFDSFSGWLEKVLIYPWNKVNSQTGKDYFSFEQNSALINLAGDKVIHETHRGRFAFAAHVTERYLQAIKDLRLTLDVSHWVVVSESYLEDQAPAVESAIARTDHIHVRVGYIEGPQVPDPRAPEWGFAVERHLEWWSRVVANKAKHPTDKSLSITPEFGPYPYLVNLPHIGKPISDQWEMNLYMMALLRKIFS